MLENDKKQKAILNYVNSFSSISTTTTPKPINTVSPLRSDLDVIDSYNNKSPETPIKRISKSPNLSTSSLMTSTADSSSSSLSSLTSTNSRNSRLQDDITRLCKLFKKKNQF